MQTADNSQAARIARRKQKILGESRRSVTFRDYSIFQQQTLGNVRFIHQNVGGLVEDAPCGCPTVSVSTVVPVVPEIKIDIVLEKSGSYDTFIATYSPTGNVVWAARIGGADGEYGYGIATDASNNIVVTGYYSSNPVYIYDASGENFKTLELSGNYNTFIAKYSQTGSVLWAARIDGGDDESRTGIATDESNNIVVTGSYYSNPLTIYDASGEVAKTLAWSGSSDTFIATYSPTGSVLWAARIGGAEYDEGRGIATDANNNIVVTGWYSSNPLTIYDASGGNFKILDNSGDSNTFIATYSPTGTVLWAARIGGIGTNEGRGIATDASNNIVVIGFYNSNPLTIYDASGEIAKTLANSSAGSDTFIATYSRTGTVLWAARIGGAGTDVGNGIATDTSNNIVVIGVYNSNPLTIYDASGEIAKTLDWSGSAGSSDTFIATYSPTGSVLWAARIGGAEYDTGYGIATDTNNNIVVTGSYSSESVYIYDASGEVAKTLDNSGSDDTFIATYSPTGTVLWAARISGTGSDTGYGIATDANNNIVVTGSYTSNPLTVYSAR